jgi:hypothetical protein
MDTLHSLFPMADLLLAIAPEDLAPVLLRLARDHRQSGSMFWPEGVTQATSITGEPEGYPYHRKGAEAGEKKAELRTWRAFADPQADRLPGIRPRA